VTAITLTKFALLVTATAAVVIALPATAHADPGNQQFASPSGNIRCDLDSIDSSVPTAMCQISRKTYTVPPGLPRDDVSGGPCPYDRVSDLGRDFRLDPGKPGYIRCTFSALDSGVGPWPTLAYGHTRSAGTLTCDSEPGGMTCTDSRSGHFFRVSRDSYQVG
jgi:hypothetical protein